MSSFTPTDGENPSAPTVSPSPALTIVQKSFALPHSIDARVYVRLEVRDKSLMVFLTTVDEGLAGLMLSTTERVAAEPAAKASLGSFVYAMPDTRNESHPMTTALYSVQSSLDTATRLAAILARKTKIPVYVSSSLSLSAAGNGGSVEEEIAIFRKTLEVITDALPQEMYPRK